MGIKYALTAQFLAFILIRNLFILWKPFLLFSSMFYVKLYLNTCKNWVEGKNLLWLPNRFFCFLQSLRIYFSFTYLFLSRFLSLEALRIFSDTLYFKFVKYGHICFINNIPKVFHIWFISYYELISYLKI